MCHPLFIVIELIKKIENMAKSYTIQRYTSGAPIGYVKKHPPET